MSQRGVFDTDRLAPAYFRLALPVVFSMVVALLLYHKTFKKTTNRA